MQECNSKYTTFFPTTANPFLNHNAKHAKASPVRWRSFRYFVKCNGTLSHHDFLCCVVAGFHHIHASSRNLDVFFSAAIVYDAAHYVVNHNSTFTAPFDNNFSFPAENINARRCPLTYGNLQKIALKGQKITYGVCPPVIMSKLLKP